MMVPRKFGLKVSKPCWAVVTVNSPNEVAQTGSFSYSRADWFSRRVKRLGVVQKNPSASHSDFVHQWVDVHAPEYLANTPGIRGYTINVVNESEKSPWGGYASLWWDDQQSYDEAAKVNAADMARQRQQDSHEPSAFGNGFMSAIADERVVL
jgi:hypothetical protein